MAKAKDKKVILDTSGDLLKEGIKANPTMIKPNSEEMESLLGISINNKDEIIKSALKLHQSGIEVVVVSLVDSLKYAISVSAANALTNSTGRFKQEDAESIYKDIEITKINIEN